MRIFVTQNRMSSALFGYKGDNEKPRPLGEVAAKPTEREKRNKKMKEKQ